ncbi:Glycosyltransferase involved in cell wall bisynthesis [Pseudomonas asplenii]|uniref:Glycosyltransferase involved in cell wall bisynthesis n=1 Tax=Pseudomonas asplenii TaxID=53407 RepID=A0A1H1RG68_9PSED|nr:glycosyltransferase [Pseudomonas asplenii]SDS34663.1 Glycosyltransferase involved in cell wall bisynthesis [Pseudomonas asplenii]
MDSSFQADVLSGRIKPLISVVLPVYNGQPFLVEAIDSILAQSVTDFELIVIDDGSSDGSLGILREYERKDPRVRVFTQKNQGLTSTLNKALELAEGQWVARMDQDDIALPFRFERQLDYLVHSNVDLVGSWVKRFGSSDQRTVRLPESEAAIKMEMLFGSPFAHPTVMMSADLARQLRYDPSCDKAEDYDLWVRAAIAGWKMANVPEVLLLYRVHPAQISTAASNRQALLSQGIKQRYWEHVFERLGKDKSCIQSIVAVRSPGSKVDIEAIDTALREVLQSCDEDARSIVLSHALRIYFRVAADCPDIVSRWKNLSNDPLNKASFRTLLTLRLLRLFRVRPDGRLFNSLRHWLIALFYR